MVKELIFLSEDEKLQQEVYDFVAEWESESPTISVKTSGSTGIPKEIEVKKVHMRISAKKTINEFKIPTGGTALLCLSTETIAGKMMIVRAIENEMILYVADIRSKVLCDLTLESVDLIAIVPIQLGAALKCNASLIKNSETVLLGGGPISSQQINDLKDIGATVIHTYGMTETLSHIAYRKVGKITEEAYTPLLGIGIRSVDGCLLIDYPELDINNLRTTDQITVHPNGHFTIHGRTDFVINSGGIKFHPEELESKIFGAIDRPFFIGAIPDPKLGERIILVIEGVKDQNDDILKDRIKPLLPKYGCPKEIYHLPEFIRSESLKILRRETLDLLL